MGAPGTGMVDRLRTAMSGTSGTRFVLLGNFEVEDRWAAGEAGLPRFPSPSGTVLVNRMDELALLLAGPDDHVLLKEPVDEEFLAYLGDLGLELPTVLAPARQDPRRTVTDDVLADPVLLDRLRGLGDGRHRLWPHGVSVAEERLSALTGLPAGPAAGVCKRVNSKIFSRLTVDELELRQPEGRVCRNGDEFAQACDWARTRLRSGLPVVVKDAFGVSGKGLVVLTEEAGLDRLQRMLARRPGAGLVVEAWIDKVTDLNYQFTVARDGTVRFDVVKESITRNGVHLGHRMPAALPRATLDEVESASGRLGARLFEAGYHGIAGVDAMLAPDGTLYPVTEINARNNMSTYQEGVRERFVAADRVAIAARYPVRHRGPIAFGVLHRAIDDLMVRPGVPDGLIITAFAGVNAPCRAVPGAAPADPDDVLVEGRLYAMAVAGSLAAAEAIDRSARSRLADVAVPVEGGHG